MSSPHSSPPRIDAHHHLWRYNPTDFDWIDDTKSSLRRDFLVDELVREAASSGVTAAVAVQARQSMEETASLLHLAESTPLIQAVVAWLPIASPNFPDTLARSRESRYLKGLRHVVQAEPPGFLADPAFNRGIQTLQGTNLTYDLLILDHQLPETIQFVDRHPNQLFVLDHLAKPAIGKPGLQAWARLLAELARRPNVFCKLSGLITESEGYRWSLPTLTPYLDAALHAFGPARLMVGTDWPVLTVGCTYAQWWKTIDSWCAPLSSTERAAILGETAQNFYHLRLEDPPAKAL